MSSFSSVETQDLASSLESSSVLSSSLLSSSDQLSSLQPSSAVPSSAAAVSVPAACVGVSSAPALSTGLTGDYVPMFVGTTGMVNPKHWVTSNEVNSMLCTYRGCDGEAGYGDHIMSGSVSRVVSPGTTACGGSGTISQRIADCELVHGTANATASFNCTAAEGGNHYTWHLVTKLQDNGYWYEVWQDEDGLIWSDRIRGSADGNGVPQVSDGSNELFNWCVASGANRGGSGSNPFASTDPDNYCDDPTYQQQGASGSGTSLPVSLCYEDGNLWTPSWVARSKGGVTLAASGVWYLPTAEDYILARKHGFRRVFPNVGSGWSPWSASVYAYATYLAWSFSGSYGVFYSDFRDYDGNQVRCVRRP